MCRRRRCPRSAGHRGCAEVKTDSAPEDECVTDSGLSLSLTHWKTAAARISLSVPLSLSPPLSVSLPLSLSLPLFLFLSLSKPVQMTTSCGPAAQMQDHAASVRVSLSLLLNLLQLEETTRRREHTQSLQVSTRAEVAEDESYGARHESVTWLLCLVRSESIAKGSSVRSPAEKIHREYMGVKYT